MPKKIQKKSAPKAKAKEAASSPSPKKAEVKITAAKGRPMLTWVGKRPLSHVTAFPAQHVETFDPTGSVGAALRGRPEQGNHIGLPLQEAIWKDWPSSYPKGGLLFHGDNKEVLAHLLANGFRGKVNLICLDPPFDSGADYVRKVSLRDPKGTAKIDGETYALGEQIQYTDIWANDNYLQFMYERLFLLKELLANEGSIYIHCDERKSHHIRCLLDEIFGSECYRNEIIWKRTTARSDSATYNHIHDTIFFYTKGDVGIFNKQYLPYSDLYLNTNFKADEQGRQYRETPLTAPGTRTGPSGQSWRGTNPGLIGRGRHWAIPSFVRHLLSEKAQENTLAALEELDRIGRIRWAKEGEGRPNVIQYQDDLQGVELQSIWYEFGALSSGATEYEEYPTQKPEALLERFLLSSSKPGDCVLDCFMGSGTTAAVAQKLGRRWIGCDINNGAIQTTSKRLQTIIQEQIESEKNAPLTLPLSPGGEDDPSASPLGKGGLRGVDVSPAQHSFTTWRVNDYDLAIQHNEAVNLACEHIGVERMRTDAYFDGTYRKSLVKIIPFGHPLTPLDLEELKRELEARPDEDRPMTVVCLGMELAAKAWIEDWNRLRKGRDAVNKIEVIELRTDPKYGKFMQHEPAKAKIRISRKKDMISFEIEDFISPTIIERLSQQAGLLKPKIDDWRAMVDCVMIDTAYDGKVFNVVLSDVPEKKTDYVQGSYELSAPGGERTVAVKIIDMLGEEVLVTKNV